MVKEIDTQVLEAHRIPHMMNAKGSIPKHIIIKMSKVKDRENLKSSKRKVVSYQ